MTLIILLGFFQYSFTKKLALSEKIPPGTVYVKSLGYYIDKTCVSVIDWKEFYWYTKKFSGDSLATLLLPDSNITKLYYESNIFDLKTSKHEHKPIIGVTLQQIGKYINFRTNAVRNLKKFRGINVSYCALDSLSHDYLKKGKGFNFNLSKVSSKMQEIYINSGHIYIDGKVVSDSPIKSNIVYGFRCIAKIK